jgi:hypothetical protein
MSDEGWMIEPVTGGVTREGDNGLGVNREGWHDTCGDGGGGCVEGWGGLG